jgi:putative intracellular protease/amidase
VEVFTVAATTDPVECAKGLRVLPDHTWDTAPAYDVLVYPGGQGTRREAEDPATLERLREVSAGER